MDRTADRASDRAPRALQPYLPFGTEGYRERASRIPGVGVLYAFASGERGACPKAVPDGCTDVVFGVGPRDVEVLLGGTVLAASDWRFDANRSWVGCRFDPAAAVLPDGLAPKDLVAHDLLLSGDAYGPVLEESLFNAEGASERMAVLEAFLSGREAAASNRDLTAASDLERYVRRRIYATDGAITVAMLARESGVSERYVRRVFSEVHGIPPKQFGCFVRFQHLLGLISEATEDGDPVAMRDMAPLCGYCDQAHLVRDFRRFTGTTPGRYRSFIKSRACA